MARDGEATPVKKSLKNFSKNIYSYFMCMYEHLHICIPESFSEFCGTHSSFSSAKDSSVSSVTPPSPQSPNLTHVNTVFPPLQKGG